MAIFADVDPEILLHNEMPLIATDAFARIVKASHDRANPQDELNDELRLMVIAAGGGAIDQAAALSLLYGRGGG